VDLPAKQRRDAECGGNGMRQGKENLRCERPGKARPGKEKGHCPCGQRPVKQRHGGGRPRRGGGRRPRGYDRRGSRGGGRPAGRALPRKSPCAARPSHSPDLSRCEHPTRGHSRFQGIRVTQKRRTTYSGRAVPAPRHAEFTFCSGPGSLRTVFESAFDRADRQPQMPRRTM
jgi:hypothetical protein